MATVVLNLHCNGADASQDIVDTQGHIPTVSDASLTTATPLSGNASLTFQKTGQVIFQGNDLVIGTQDFRLTLLIERRADPDPADFVDGWASYGILAPSATNNGLLVDWSVSADQRQLEVALNDHYLQIDYDFPLNQAVLLEITRIGSRLACAVDNFTLASVDPVAELNVPPSVYAASYAPTSDTIVLGNAGFGWGPAWPGVMDEIVLSIGTEVDAPIEAANLWRATVTLAGVDVSDQVVGEIVVEAEENAARIADLTLAPPAGTVLFLPDWVGRPITIDTTDAGSGAVAPRRIFTGIVELPKMSLKERTVHLRCTDNLQERVAALSKDEIAALVGGYWSGAVFDAAAIGWTYARDRLSTVTAALDMRPDGTLRMTPWAARSTPDFSFDADIVEEDGLDPDLAERSALCNKVEIEFGYRFPRVLAQAYVIDWQYVDIPQMSFDTFLNNNYSILPRSQVQEAIQSAGGAVLGSIDWIPMPSTPRQVGGGYWLPGPYDDLMCMGFRATVVFDHARQWEEKHKITVLCPAAVAAMGAITERMSGALEGQYQQPESAESKIAAYRTGVSSLPPTDMATPQAGKTTAADTTLTAETNRDAANSAIQCLIAIAKARIWASHRGTRVPFTVPHDPRIDIDQTASVNCGGVATSAKVFKVVHRLTPDSGRAVTEITLAPCMAVGLGIAHPEDPTAYSDSSAANPVAINAAPVISWAYTPGETNFQQFSIQFPGVDAADRNPASEQFISSIQATLVEDPFEVTL